MSTGLNADGRLEVFARGSDNALWHCWQTNPHAGPWSKGFSSLGGEIASGPSVARRRLELSIESAAGNEVDLTNLTEIQFWIVYQGFLD
jgi:Repeat of unknown function (DUF346)